MYVNHKSLSNPLIPIYKIKSRALLSVGTIAETDRGTRTRACSHITRRQFGYSYCRSLYMYTEYVQCTRIVSYLGEAAVGRDREASRLRTAGG